MNNASLDVSSELTELRARLACLEAERTSARRRLRWLSGAAVLAALVGTGASAASGACPNGLPVCFTADTPAHAEEVNHNFAQLKEWLEAKVGAATTPAVRITSGAAITTITPPTQATRALFVSSSTASNVDPIADFRHDNLSQGVGIGWNTILATGSVANQDLFLVAKGTGQINSASPLNVGAVTTTCTAGPCYCNAGLSPLSWTGTCANAGVAVYSAALVTMGSQRGFDVQCINSAFTATAPMRNLTVVCSRLITP